MERRRVDVFLPKFDMSWSSGRFTAWLSALGMPMAFDRAQANFSGINGVEPPDKNAFVISDVFQTALVEVNEQGTEAAAANFARSLQESQGPPPPVPRFRADHPFLFAIVDQYSNSILFLGRVSDPRD